MIRLIEISSLALSFATTLIACGSSQANEGADAAGPAVEDEPLVETDTTTLTEQSIDGAPMSHRLRARRLDNRGHRAVDHFDGQRWAAFFADTESSIPLFMAPLRHGNATLVCTQTTEQVDSLDGVRVMCAVRSDGADRFGERGIVEGEPSAWLRDVCTGSGHEVFTLLVSSSPSPVPALSASGEELDELPCGSLAWNGTSWHSNGPRACRCDQQDGMPCSDPCVLGTGTWREGRCDLSGQPACDDGDPDTLDSCTGNVLDLCRHDRS